MCGYPTPLMNFGKEQFLLPTDKFDVSQKRDSKSRPTERRISAKKSPFPPSSLIKEDFANKLTRNLIGEKPTECPKRLTLFKMLFAEKKTILPLFAIRRINDSWM